jgi:hypothetical protein
MAKDKDRSINPAQVQRKLEKQKAVKKGKADALARRNEKLARRNPDRIQRQINDIKAVERSGQPLRPREKQMLEELERDLRAVQKAREALGDQAPKFGNSLESRNGPQGNQRRGDSVLGKRRRDGQWKDSSSSDTDESVRKIPMPKDTPPPIPRQYPRRREHPGRSRDEGGEDGESGEGERQTQHPLPLKPAVLEPKTVYEAAPVIRNLQQEAVSKFVPAAVQRKQEAVKGQGKLVEPEEMDRLEKAGYLPSNAGGGGGPERSTGAGDDADPDEPRLAEEEERFSRELKSVQIEDVEDDED